MKRAVHFILKKLGLLSLYSLRRSGYLLDKGWFQSFRAKASVDRSGRPIPWMTYAFLDFLEPRLRGNFNVFEFGSGNSTHWWAARVRAVSSCEHDAEWFARVSEGVPPNATVLHRSVTNQAYRSVLREDDHVGQPYDVIVIDGADRVGCALNCLESLRPDGVVIWDNSDRSDYEEGYEFLLGKGFRRLDFHGLGPINVMAWCTSVFYREENCLGL